MQAGTPFPVTVEARDANNALAENFTGSVALNAKAAGGANFEGGTPNAAAVAGVASFSGLVLNTAANSYVVVASSSGLIAGISNSFNVTEPVLLALAYSIASSSIDVGTTTSLTATAYYSDGTSGDVTDTAKWAAQNPAVAAFDGPGRLTGIEAGATGISVTYGDVSDSGFVTVVPTLQSITIQTASRVIVGSGSQQLSATGTYSDGTTQDITKSVEWSSSDDRIARIDAAGLAQAGGASGSVTIVAASGTITTDVGLSVISSDTRFVYAAAAAGIEGFAVDAESGTLNPVPGSPFCLSIDCPPGETLAQDPLGRFVFTTVGPEIRSYSVDQDTGTLTLTGAQFAGDIQDLEIDPTGRFLFALDVNAMLGAFRIDAHTGELASAGDATHAGEQPNAIMVHPTGRFLYVTGRLGSITGIGIDSEGAVTRLVGFPVAVGPTATTTAFPGAMSPSGSHLFVPRAYRNADGQSITDLATLAIDGTTGAVAFASAVPLDGAPSSNAAGHSAPLVQPSGRFLHVVLDAEGAGSRLYTLALDATTGALSPATGNLVITTHGVHAQALTPSGDVIYLAGYDSPGIERFVVDPATGRITPAGGFFGTDTRWSDLILVNGASGRTQH
jgi:6-phosphogluconolactonase (cycloisomerase 2 family)